VGLAADIGSLAFVPKVTGNESLVREYAYTGQSFSAVEAEKMGLLSKIVPGGRDEVVKEALALAALIASKSPIAVTGTKHLIGHSRDNRCVLGSPPGILKANFLSALTTIWRTPLLGMHLLS